MTDRPKASILAEDAHGALAMVDGGEIVYLEKTPPLTMKQALLNLIGEFPADQVIFRTMNKTFTGADMLREIEAETDIGKQYSSDLLRVSRDLLARQAQNQKGQKK